MEKSVKTQFDRIHKLGDLFRAGRLRANVTIKAASEATKIRAEFIENLEEGNYAAMPPDVYTKGFISSYAQFLGISADRALALYRRENNIEDRSVLKPLRRDLHKELKFKITQEKVIAILAISIVVIVVGYIFGRINAVVKAPNISLTDPIGISTGSEQIYTTNQATITLKGKVEIGSELTINNNKVDTKNLEIFEIPDLKLSDGENVFELIATSQFGIKSKVRINVKKQEGAISSVTPTELPDGEEKATEMFVEIIVGPTEANLKVTVDGNMVQDKVEANGVTKTFTAKNSIKIQTPRPTSIKIAINGQIQTLNSSQEKEWILVDGNVIAK